MNENGNFGKKVALLILTVGIAMLLLVSVALAAGGNPPPWWNNPQGYSSWRRATTNSSTWIEVSQPELVVTLTVPNEARPNAWKGVWMQVEWDNASSDDITLTTAMAWSYGGCNGPWDGPAPLEPVDHYTPTAPTSYTHGAEFAGFIDPQPACELITVTFKDRKNDGVFTIRYNIEVQTLCFDKTTSAKVVDAFASPLAALPLLGLSLTGLIWHRRQRRR